MFDEKGCDDHPHPVMHPSGAPELPHAGIDHRITGRSALPRGNSVAIFPPGKSVKARLEVFRSEIGMLVKKVIGKFTPIKLGDEFLDIARGGTALARERGRGRVPDLPRADLAETKMRRGASTHAPDPAGRGLRRSH